MRKFLSLTVILLFFAVLVNAQTPEITGKITDSTGNPVAGASVKVKGAKRGTSAGTDGTFRISVPKNATLIISGVGFETQEVKVSNSSSITVQLHIGNSSMLNEVVVTSLGIKREKRNLTYSTQEIKGDAVLAAKQDNIINGLAGKVSGVQISNTTGMPGSSARIVIRGATSLMGDNQPLFVVDGVPVDNSEAGPIDATQSGSANASLNQGSSSNRAIDIDPNIVESYTVLKGAAATALYGSAAARGAIIITTKNGGRGKPQISVSSSYSAAKPYLYDVQTEFAQGTGGQYYDGIINKASTSWGPALDTLRVNGAPVKVYNQQKLFFRTGHTTDNNVSVSGATDKSKYLMSYSYLKNDGITPHTDFTRSSFFGKFTNQVSSKVSANIQVNYISSVNNRVSEGNGLTNPLWTVFAAPPTWNPLPSTMPDGSQNLYRSPARNNPYYLLDNTGFVSTVNRFLPTATIVYNPTSWMSVTERLGADVYSDEASYHESNGVNLGVFNNSGGVSNRTETYRQYNNDLMIEAHHDLAKDLYGSFLIGTNLLDRYDRVYTQTGQGQNVAQFYNISNFSTITAVDALSRYRKIGYYAQANLEYKKMLNLALTGRYDGSSVLSTSKQYYPYGSAALGFIFSELMDKGSFLDFGKVRVSYSSVGNDNLVPYASSTPFFQASGSANNILYPFNGQNGFLLSTTLGNPNLINESLKEFETGLELKFFHNRLSFEGSYFIRKTSNLLTPINVGQSSGYFAAQMNAGSMQDKGFEILLSGTPIKNRDFSWDVSGTFTLIRNKVLKLAPNVQNIQAGGFGGGGGVYAFPGKPYGVIYGSAYLRDSATHKIVVGDPGTDGAGLPITANEFAIVGNTNPDFIAGLSNTFNYKGFSLNFVVDWKQGGQTLNLDDHYNWFYGTPKATAVNHRAPITPDAVYQTSGKQSTTPVAAQDWFATISNIDEASVENTTYVKLRSASLGYSLSPATLNKTPFKSITFTFTGTNLFIYKPFFSSPDPEASLQGSGNGQGVVNYMTPTSRTFILGVRVGF